MAKKPDTTITRDEWLDALDEAHNLVDGGAHDPDALTTHQLSLKWNLSERRVREMLRVLRDKGRVTITTQRVIDAAGRSTHVPAYKLKA